MYVVRYYGAKEDSPDYRDYRKTYSQAEVLSRYSPNVDLRHYVDHIYDQAQLGSCTANALCGAYGLDLKKQSLTLRGGYQYFDPSRLFLYYNTRAYEKTTYSDAGASIRDTVKSMNRQGVCSESDWPYNTRRFTEKPPQTCYRNAKGNNLCKYERLDQDINQLRACLKDNCPFVFGFKVYNSFHNQSNRARGDTPLPTWDEKLRSPLGLHAVMAVGYADQQRRIIVANSWGDGWGHNGYFYMPYNFITDSSLCFDFWKITFACQRDKPRPKDTVTYPLGSGSGGYSSGPSYSYGSRGYSSSACGSSGACGYGNSGRRW